MIRLNQTKKGFSLLPTCYMYLFQRLKKMYSDNITEIFCIPVNFDYILRHVDYYTGILHLPV